ncbi:hypothetical protein BH11VER1_BH11VER1_29250 [soil metagenome]
MIGKNKSVSSPHAYPRIPWWLWLNVLSLDAPLVAVLWQWALAQAYGVQMDPVTYSTLGLTVWLIYVVDRVFDTRSVDENHALAARHLYYRQHYRFFVWCAIPSVAIFLMYRVFTALPATILWRGIGLGFLVGMYLLHFVARGHRRVFILGSVFASFLGGFILYLLPLPLPYKLVYGVILLSLLYHSIRGGEDAPLRLLPKELLCGYLFAVGCSMSVHFYTLDSEAAAFSMTTFLLAMLCTLNCIGIACYEKDGDPHAITHVWPEARQYYPLLLLAFTTLVFFEMGKNLAQGVFYYHVALLFGAAILGAVHYLSKRVSSELAHVLADTALMLPVLAMLLI